MNIKLKTFFLLKRRLTLSILPRKFLYIKFEKFNYLNINTKLPLEVILEDNIERKPNPLKNDSTRSENSSALKTK